MKIYFKDKRKMQSELCIPLRKTLFKKCKLYIIEKYVFKIYEIQRQKPLLYLYFKYENIKNPIGSSLTPIPEFSDDAGTYACTATNGLGSTVTSATLQVPGNRRSVYGI
jgi:hypothetical protein